MVADGESDSFLTWDLSLTPFWSARAWASQQGRSSMAPCKPQVEKQRCPGPSHPPARPRP